MPSDLRYTHERAKAYQMIELHEEAVADFNTVLAKCCPSRAANVYFRRAFSLKALKRYQEAIDDFEKARSLEPMNERFMVNYKKLKGV